jgi:AbrB family looped-hinge helix DNA binding protein
MPYFATVLSRGRITIPKAIREKFNLLPGCRIEFLFNAEGELVLRKVEISGDSNGDGPKS